LLERVTIAVVAVLLVAALVGWIKYDMQRTAASQQVTRAGMNSRNDQLRAAGEPFRLCRYDDANSYCP
jgi:hypothetical protein